MSAWSASASDVSFSRIDAVFPLNSTFRESMRSESALSALTRAVCSVKISALFFWTDTVRKSVRCA